MRHWTRRFGLGVAVLVVGVVSVGAVDRPQSVPLGDPDYYPSPEQVVGWRGDGSGNFPGAHPVTEWSALKGTEKNLVWKLRLPSWGCGSPIVVGDKVILCVEPHTILCYGAKDGRLLWHNRHDVLDIQPGDVIQETQVDYGGRPRNNPGLPIGKFVCTKDPAEAAKLRELLSIYLDVWYHCCRVGWPELNKETQSRMRPLIATLQAAGADDNLGRPEGDGWTKDSAGRDRKRLFYEHGLYVVPHVGHTYATPVSDGKYVWMAYATSTVACYDIAGGKCLWMKYYPDWETLGSGVPETWCGSPYLADGVLVTTGGRRIRGIDAKTGEQLWKIKYGWKRMGHGSCAIWSAINLISPSGKLNRCIVEDTGEVIRCRDGKILVPTGIDRSANGKAGKPVGNCLPNCEGGSTMPVVDDATDIVLYPNGAEGGGQTEDHGLWAVQYKMTSEDSGEGKVLWWYKGRNFRVTQPPSWPAPLPSQGGGTAPWSASAAVACNGWFFTGDGRAFEILTGKFVQPPKDTRESNSYGNPVATAELIAALDGNKSSFLSVTPPTTCVASSSRSLICYPKGDSMKGEDYGFDKEWLAQQVKAGIIGWVPLPPMHGNMITGYGANAFLVGDRVFLRTRSTLFCFGDTAKPWHSPKDAPPVGRVTEK